MTPTELKIILAYEPHKITSRILIKKYDINNLYKDADSSLPNELITKLKNLRKEV